MNHRITALACAVLLAAPLSALAADESPYSWEVAAVSDYVFLGSSQTDEFLFVFFFFFFFFFFFL